MIFSVESSDSLLGWKALSARSLSLLSVILFSPCINSEFRQIFSLCHCQVLLFKRSFLLILYFPGNLQGGPLCLAWGRKMQADLILKEPPSWVPPLASQGGASRREGARPPSYAPEYLFFHSICFTSKASDINLPISPHLEKKGLSFTIFLKCKQNCI